MNLLRCVRCSGLLVSEDWYGGERDPEVTFEKAYRCTGCGFIMDKTILENKKTVDKIIIEYRGRGDIK